jgi:hypothetical protein
LVPAKPPADAFEHFVRMLTPGYEVVTGRKNQRVWWVGGIEVDQESRTLTGKLGWQPREEEIISEWVPAEKDWLSSTAEPRQRKLMPFGFDGEKRLLGVVADGSSAPPTIAAVFEKILRANENELQEPSTEWSVEPVLDRENFIGWLKALDVVRSVSFTARLPNPEPSDAFGDLWGRMDRSHATQYTETMKSGAEEGLIEVEQDRDFSQAIVMAEQGFAQLQGKGTRNGVVSKYSQKNDVATERVPELPHDWNQMRAMLKGFLKGRLRRFLEDDQAA